MTAEYTGRMTTTPVTTDLHIVIAALGGKHDRALIGYTAVSAPRTYSEALALFDRLEEDRRNNSWVSNAGVRRGGHVLWYAVRSLGDPRWDSLLSQGYADAVDRKTGWRSYKSDGGDVKAAKAWAKDHGYTGRQGGWIYDASGKPYIQGWSSFAYVLKQRGAIAEGANGLWYVLDRELVQ